MITPNADLGKSLFLAFGSSGAKSESQGAKSGCQVTGLDHGCSGFESIRFIRDEMLVHGSSPLACQIERHFWRPSFRKSGKNGGYAELHQWSITDCGKITFA
jgi:hypothetical protein